MNLYHTVDQTFVLAIRVFFQSSDEEDYVRAWEFQSLPEALEKLETYDASQDVHVKFDLSETCSVADLTAKALDLHARTAASRSHYAGIVGEFFYDLEQH